MEYSVRLLPSLTCNVLLITVMITITLSYYYDHVSHIPAYISDTGATPPESCIFGQVMNMLWVVISFMMYVKYRQVNCLLIRHNIAQKRTLNKSAFIIGLIGAFGCTIVGNFQEINMLIVHWFGAVLVFGLGSIYQCLQASLYTSLVPIIGQRKRTKLRVILSFISLITFFIFFVTGIVSYTQFKGENILKWKEEDGGFKVHSVSTVTEWLCAVSSMFFIMMFSWEFKLILVRAPDVIVLDRNILKEFDILIK